MESETFNELLQTVKFRQRLIWFGFTASFIVYIPLLLIDNLTIFTEQYFIQNMDWAFYALATVLAGGSVMSRRYFLSSRWLESQAHKEVALRQLAIDEEDDQVDLDKLAKIESLDKAEVKFLAVAQWHLWPLLISLMLNEFVAMVGLAFVLSGANKISMLPFIGVSIVLNVLMYPRLEDIIERARTWVYS
jgi:hypothetical protein